jgi:hypothetical protein
MHITERKEMSSVEKHEPGGRFYSGILPTVLSTVYFG